MSFSDAERDQELFRNIIEAFEFIKRYTDGMVQAEFLIDPKTQDAVAMRLQQILECAGKISADEKSNLKINWSSLVAMRNKISHSYIDVDAEIVWEVIKTFEEFERLIEWALTRV